ncbi:colicin E5-related ribonuclease [Brevundimonas sp. PAMC22021]|uniref:colicin E5-related ribonuclease n=1 Tax=Brevundimonas sp. PAMC22021 TaxID=2861285 RepID=UPI001C634261|nr:colicin E5-related ribonuclease [Brevundimonas sp. PAMC22021]QYF86649.1 hypothetical protein KY493_12615 [Brevundimonas sp. PAMC22021]
MVKSSEKLARQMAARGWTMAQVEEAVERGLRHAAVRRETNSPATRYVHPQTGRSVVIDDRSGEIIHVGGDGFIY